MTRFVHRALSLVLITSLVLSQLSATIPVPAKTGANPLKLGLVTMWRNALTATLSNA